MSNSLYAKARQSFAGKLIDWAGDNIQAALVTSAYTPNLLTDDFISLLPGGSLVAIVALSGKSETLGICTCSNFTFGSVAGTQTVTQMIIYRNSGGGAGSSQFIFLIDTAGGLPFVTDGGNIDVSVDPTNGLFQL